MQQQLIITLEAPNIKLTTNDNAVQLRGKTDAGWQDKSFMKDDPELSTELNSLLDDMESYQRGKLEAFTGTESPALDQFDNEMTALREAVQTIIEKQNEV